ncbi:MAG: ABC transporter permease [Candidatus Acidiferrales bacterium]
MQTLLQDLKYAVRALAKSPSFTLVALLTLALGIGANTAIFSVINSVLLSPLPYKNPRQLVNISAANMETGIAGIAVSYTRLQHLQRESHVLESVGAFFPFESTLTGRGEPEQVSAGRVTGNLFHVLGITPAIGRDFLPAEDQPGGADVVILSDSFWHNHFGGDPSLVGQAISLDGRSATVVGILPPSFHFPFQQPEPGVWVPRVFEPSTLLPTLVRSGAGFLFVIGRLNPGESLARFQAELAAINPTYRRDNPGFADAPKYILAATSLDESLVGGLRSSLIVLLVAVGFVLLIACANVANLLLARATAREKEIAIRQALGASRSRLVRQLFTESLLLSLVGGSLGALIAAWCLPLLRFVTPGAIPRIDEVRIDARVLLFSLALCILTGIAFGLVPSLQQARRDLHETLKDASRGSTDSGRGGRARRLMVVAEVAIALVLVTGAGLLIESFVRLARVNPGFDSRNVLTIPLTLPSARYSDPEKRAELLRQLLERIQSLPTVESASAVSHVPLYTPERFVFFCPQGRACEGLGKDPIISMRQITPGYFRTLHIPLLRGRDFEEKDAQGSTPVAIIDQLTAARYFPDSDPIGKTIMNSRDKIPMQIVGVVACVKTSTLNAPDVVEMYMPHRQSPWASMTLLIRSSSATQPLVSAVREKIAGLDPDLPVAGIQSMDHIVSTSVAQPRLLTSLVGAFAGFALLLAALGIYGVMAYSVSQRIHEVGIRMALGASPRDVFTLVVGQGMRLVLIGVALGFIASLALTRLLSSLLFGTSATDPATFAIVALTLIAVALLACYLPARRATRVDPLIALRYE